jgi:predicted metalloprotease with PDZ domain
LPACWLGAKFGNDLTLLNVYTGGPAERAGLAPHDVLVAIDDICASTDSIDASLMRGAPGQVISIHAFRRDELLRLEAALASDPPDTRSLSARTDATEDARALRDSWLAGA